MAKRVEAQRAQADAMNIFTEHKEFDKERSPEQCLKKAQ